MPDTDKSFNEPKVRGQMAGMLSHGNIHKQQCDQLYFIGKAAPVLMNHSSPKLKLKHIYDLESEQPNPLNFLSEKHSAKRPSLENVVLKFI